jgi:hypothetical protein
MLNLLNSNICGFIKNAIISQCIIFWLYMTITDLWEFCKKIQCTFIFDWETTHLFFNVIMSVYTVDKCKTELLSLQVKTQKTYYIMYAFMPV